MYAAAHVWAHSLTHIRRLLALSATTTYSFAIIRLLYKQSGHLGKDCACHASFYERNNTRQKCGLCGKGGHAREDCPSVENGEHGPTLYKGRTHKSVGGKHSKRPLKWSKSSRKPGHAAAALVNNSLLAGASDGDVLVIGQLLEEAGAVIDTVDKRGYTPLILAAEQGHDEVAALLLDRGAMIDINGQRGVTALSLAAKGGHTSVVSLLLGRGALVDGTGGHRVTAPLTHAASRGYTDITRKLLAAGANVNRATPDGLPALMCAARGGHSEVALLLLDAGADVDAVAGRDGRTALMFASSAGHTATAAILLDAGAAVDFRGSLPGSAATCLALAAQHGHAATVALLLQRGAFADRRHGAEGKTALLIAAQEGHPDAVGHLLEAGAAVSQTDVSGNTALMLAAARDHYHVVVLLEQVQARWTVGPMGRLRDMPRFIKNRAITVVLCLKRFDFPNEIVDQVLAHCRLSEGCKEDRELLWSER